MGERVNARIRVLESALRRLDEISAMSLEDFLKDRFAPAAAERSFQVAIEVVIDLANTLASKVGRRSPLGSGIPDVIGSSILSSWSQFLTRSATRLGAPC